MEEDIKILEEIYTRPEINSNNETIIKVREKSIKNVVNRVKEDEAVIDEMAEFMNKRSWKEHQLKDEICICCKIEYSSDECVSCIKEYFRKKVQNG